MKYTCLYRPTALLPLVFGWFLQSNLIGAWQGCGEHSLSRQWPENIHYRTYDVKTNTSGRSKIGRDARQEGRIPSANSATRSNASIIFAFCFLYFIAGLTFVDKLPVWVLGVYILTSIAAFIAYELDKSAAKNNKWRTQEATLHLFALAGGWPGALVAQWLFRHNNQKTIISSRVLGYCCS